MSKEGLISFVKFKRENEEYLSFGHYRGKNSAPRPVDLGEGFARSSIFPKGKGDLTSNIRLSRSLENLRRGKSPKVGNSFISRKSISLSSGLNTDDYVFEESHSSSYHLPKNITKSHLLLSCNIQYPKIRTSSQRPESLIFAGYDRQKISSIKPLAFTHYVKNDPLVDKSSPLLFHFLNDSHKKSISGKCDRQINQPIVVKIILSSTSTQRVGKSARRSVCSDPYIFIKSKLRNSAGRFSLFMKKPQTFQPDAVFHAKRSSVKNINSFKALPVADDGCLVNICNKETKVAYESFKEVCLRKKVNSASHGISFVKSFNLKMNSRAENLVFENNLLVTNSFPFLNHLRNLKYWSRTEGQLCTLKDVFQRNITFSKGFIENFLKNSFFLGLQNSTVILNFDLNDSQHVCQILPFEAFTCKLNTETRVIPESCLNSNTDFDTLSLLQVELDFVTARSALTLVPNCNVVFVVFIKSFYGNSNAYLYNAVLQHGASTEVRCNDRTFSKDSYVTLDIKSVLNCLRDIKFWILEYKSLDNIQNTKYMDQYQVFVGGRFLLTESTFCTPFQNLLPDKTTRSFPSFLHHNVPLLSALQPLNHFLPYILGTFCDSRRLSQYTTHRPKHVVSRGLCEFRIDDQRFVAFTMDWMRCIGSEVMISDDQLTTVLQHLLISVEKGIERLEWTGIAKTWSSPSGSPQSSTFPRCCHVSSNPVDTKDSSVQTIPERDTDKESDGEDVESSKPDIALDLRNYSCVTSDSQNVSVVEKNYIPNCESIATQTSTDLSPSKLQDLPKSGNELMFGLAPVAVREEDPDDGYCEHVLIQPATISQVDPDLLHSQIALLPGCRDIKGRSVVVINSDVIGDCVQLSACHLAQLLLYFHTIPKKEVVGKGFLVLIDGTKASEEFWNMLDETFCLIEANLSNVISEVLVLLPPGQEVLDSNTLFHTSRVQCETLSTCEKLQNFIHREQLLNKYDGSYIYDHQEWISFRKFLEPFINGCRLSGRHLVNLLEELRGSRIPVSSSLTHQMIEQQKRNVSHTFHDEQLRHLEEEGDTILKELQSYGVRAPHNHDYRENLERTGVLYDELRKAMTKLARLADKRLSRLEECLQLKTFQEESSQVLSWLCRKGNESLEKHQAIADSLGAVKQQEEEFEKFYFLAMRQIEKGNDLLEEVSTFGQDSPVSRTRDENSPEAVEDRGGVQELATSLRQHLGSFSEKLEGTRERIEDTAKCYQLMDKSYEWALDAMRFVSNMGITNTESPDGIIRQIKCLQDYSDNHLRVPEDTFSEMLELASRHGNEKLLEQCKIVKLRCEETVELIQTRQATLQKVKQQMEVDSLRGPFWEAEDATQTPRTIRSHSQPSWLPVVASTPYTSAILHHQRRRSTGGPMGVSAQQRYGSPIGSYTSFPSSYYPTSRESYQLDSYIQEKEDQFLNHGLITEDLTSNGPVASISKALLDTRLSQKEGSSSSSSSSSSYTKDLSNIFRSSGRSSSSSGESKTCKRLTRRCQMWQLRDEALEKAKAEVREQTALLRVERLHNKLDEISANRSEVSEAPGTEKSSQKSISQVRTEPVRGPVPVNTHLMSQVSPDVPDHSANSEDISKSSEAKSKKTLMLIMKELIQTERDYVKSLEYIIENYIPELMREDIPQALRGQRNVVFGNIEKIYEFHNQYFLTELEHCENNPFIVGQCFLDFQPQFYLYALYNKNKPKSDALMSEYGNTFFRKKQLELQDKMDLASYLLKPVQRMGKYALLLKQLLKECPERETEHKALKAAEEMVRFQLRHGNDLLAMDALKDSDVNVKEQGRLLRQDEFIVWQGRSRKCMRHVFLFEDLILFSKARRDPQRKGYEMYQYKHSIKTTDLGITEQIGDSPTKFEIWFRKRKLNDTFLLQAPNPEVKAAWVSDLRKILVKQAVKNRENRLAEMSSMGIGNKPCLDIKPSEDQISDRSISIHQLARAPRFRNSIAVSPYDLRNNRNSIISVSSSSSSGSSQSSFSFYGTLNLGFEPGDSPRPLHRSLTQQSQCSTESGFYTDASTAGDSPENEEPRHKRAERSDSLLSSDSLSTNVSPTEAPCLKYEQSFEESLTTPM